MIIEGKHSELGQGIFISDIQDGSNADKVCSVHSTQCTARVLLKPVSFHQFYVFIIVIGWTFDRRDDFGRKQRSLG